jgi:predicted Na+-dependent transporter
LPIIVGQFLRPRIGDKVDAWKPQLSTFSSLTLLMIIYTTFCNTFCDGMCTPSDIRNPLASWMTPPAEPDLVRPGRRPSITSIFHHSVRRLAAVTKGVTHDEAKGGVFGSLSTNALVATCAAVVAMQIVLMVLAYAVSSSKKFQKAIKVEWTRPDVVSILFSSVHKSLTLGVPVLKIVFATSPILPLLSLPLLMYHPIQIVIGGIAAPSIKKWVTAGVGLPLTLSPTSKPPPKLLSAKAVPPAKATV